MQLARPRPWDVTAALIAAAALAADGIARGSAPVGITIALSLLACLPLAWASQAPLQALLATAAGSLLCLAVFQPYDTAIVPLAFALYAVANRGDRRRSLLVGVATTLFVVAVILVVASDSLATTTVIRVAVIVIALTLGDTVRSRRELGVARQERDLRIAQEREHEQRRRLADERLRIARDLHDTVAHALVAINVRASVAAHLRGGDDDALTDITAVSAEALDDLRRTLGLLRDNEDPAPTSPTLDLASVTQLVERAKATGLDAEADVDLNGQAIPTAVGQAGYRIVQEALTNVMRHAPQSHAHVRLRVDGNSLEIDVEDDGRAAVNGTSSAGGHGLTGMRERAAALGGEVTAGPAPDGGWHVHTRLPLAPAGRG